MSKRKLALARRFRKEMTPAERELWKVLRNRNLGGYKFRRQKRIGSYIVDFYCPKCKLVIEVDGAVHINMVGDDTMRTAWLEEQGYRVIRFNNNQVLREIEAVARRILEVCDRVV